MSTNPVLNPVYAVPDNSKQRYPALQVDEYNPRNLQSKINFCLSEESAEILTDRALELLNLQPIEASFKSGNVNLFIINNLQAIVLDVSRIYIYNKGTERYESNSGQELGGDLVSCRKVFLALMVGEELVTGDDGKAQVFTLNLKSYATDLIGSPKTSKPGDGSIYSLNTALVKHYQIKGKLTHLVRVPLLVAPTTRTSKLKKESSFAPKYSLGDKATPLTEELQKAMFELLQDPQLRSDIDNPYRIDDGAMSVEAAPPDDYYE